MPLSLRETRVIRCSNQRGFTLIELMIVVAIIGVLASFAVPQYQNYVGRAQVGEALSLMSPVKAAISEYHITHGVFPDDNEQAGLSAPDQLSGRYVASIDVSQGEPGVTVITMQESSVVSELEQGGTLVFDPNGEGGEGIDWECKAGGGNEIDPKFLPSECR
ncbi:pilin [Halomonas sp. MC140]|nr:pilin [Halomonas sp. MC140]MDN7132481.1 pilin [Halomonas sp. MC140]